MDRIRVLVVDDEPGVRAVLRESLAQLGYEIHEAQDGAQALNKIDGGLHPDVILLDLLMPVMDGQQMLDELMRRKHDVPVIVMSGYFDRDEFAGVEAFDRIPKPIDLDRIVLAIERALAEQRRPTP